MDYNNKKISCRSRYIYRSEVIHISCACSAQSLNISNSELRNKTFYTLQPHGCQSDLSKTNFRNICTSLHVNQHQCNTGSTSKEPGFSIYPSTYLFIPIMMFPISKLGLTRPSPIVSFFQCLLLREFPLMGCMLHNKQLQNYP